MNERNIRLSVVDQSPVHDGKGPQQAINDTLTLARACDNWGYHRFWLGEHHAAPCFASATPEIMVAHIAANTDHIRVGSGGVMLNNYSPLKVAESFRLLDALHPGRIDLGVGSSYGGGPAVADALSFPDPPFPRKRYSEKLEQLVQFLGSRFPPEEQHPLRVVPEIQSTPELWILGEGLRSAELAARLGAGFALGLFIGDKEQDLDIFAHYRAAFTPNTLGTEPGAMLVLHAFCAPNETQALETARSLARWKVASDREGIRPLFEPSDEIDLDSLPAEHQAYFDSVLARMVIGTPQQCQQQFLELADRYQVNEIAIINACYEFYSRLRTYELLAPSKT